MRLFWGNHSLEAKEWFPQAPSKKAESVLPFSIYHLSRREELS